MKAMMYVCVRGHLHSRQSPWPIVGLSVVREDLSANAQMKHESCPSGHEENQKYKQEEEKKRSGN
jgi:hypothetical protein